MIYDCIIVGAGPAGAVAGWHLARAGLKTLILDNNKFPRHKACAGGVPSHALALINESGPGTAGLDPALVRARVRNIEFRYRKRVRPYTAATEIIMVDRSEFDAFLVNRACAAGCAFTDQQRVIRLSEGQQLVTVETVGHTYKAKSCIAADGALSVCRSCLFPEAETALRGQLGWATEIRTVNRKQSNTAVMEIDSISKGYGWIFPHGRELSCGIGTMNNRWPGLVNDTRRFLGRMGLTDELSRVRGAALAAITRSVIPRVAAKRTLLAGDAAFLVDPLSGEGIYQALKSGQRAAAGIIENVSRLEPDFSGYQAALQTEFYQEYVYANILAEFMFSYPAATWWFGIRNDRVVGIFERLLRGELKYSEVFSGIRELVRTDYRFKLLVALEKQYRKNFT